MNFFNLFIIFSLFNKLYFTTSLSLLKSIGVVSNLTVSNLSTLPLSNLSISFNLVASDFKLGKLVFLAKSDISTPVGFLKSDFLHNYTKIIQLSHFIVKLSVFGNVHSFMLCLFY